MLIFFLQNLFNIARFVLDFTQKIFSHFFYHFLCHRKWECFLSFMVFSNSRNECMRLVILTVNIEMN